MARKMWRTLEPYHGLVYFAPEARNAYEALGIDAGDGYFVSRSAPMGAVEPSVVIAAFFNFNPDLITHALPAAWSKASPQAVIEARLAGVDGALRRSLGDEVSSPVCGPRRRTGADRGRGLHRGGPAAGGGPCVTSMAGATTRRSVACDLGARASSGATGTSCAWSAPDSIPSRRS